MSRILLLLAVGWGCTGPVGFGADSTSPVHLPAGSRLIYQQNFETNSAAQDFQMCDPGAWKISTKSGNGALELLRQSQYEPPFRSPYNIALISEEVFGDFVLEADLVQTGREYGHRDMCVFFGFQAPSKFYYAHIAAAADEHAHNIFIVNGQPRTKIAERTTQGVHWGLEVWHKVRLERRVSDGLIRVFFDDLEKPIMEAHDQTFTSGYIGFGSFDDTGKVDNIRIWAPSSQRVKKALFPSIPAAPSREKQ